VNMNDKMISISVMCSDLMNLGRDIDRIKAEGIEMLHLDVMDAHFVPNLTFGPDMIKAMRRYSDMPLDIHLMVEYPERLIPMIELSSKDILTAHVELDRDLAPLAGTVHDAGSGFGVAISPDTPVEVLARHKGLFEYVTLMLVYPGFAGAKLVDGILEKVPQTRKWLDDNGLENVKISVDGSVNCERANWMAKHGTDIFVAGTAGIYRKGVPFHEAVAEFRKAITI